MLNFEGSSELEENISEEFFERTQTRVCQIDFEVHTRAVTQFRVIPFSPIGSRYVQEVLDRATIPMGPERRIVRQVAALSSWILDNPTNPNVDKVTTITERTLFGQLAPFYRGLERTGELHGLPSPLEWMQELRSRGVFLDD